MLPAHRVYVEPFAGSAAVLFAKRPVVHEVINDLNGDVVTFFRVLREQPDAFELACRLTPYAREEFARADMADQTLTDLERARRWWIRVNQSFAKAGATNTGWSTSIKRGSNNARSATNRLDWFHQVAARLMNVTIEHRCALEVIAAYGAADAVCRPADLPRNRGALRVPVPPLRGPLRRLGPLRAPGPAADHQRQRRQLYPCHRGRVGQPAARRPPNAGLRMTATPAALFELAPGGDPLVGVVPALAERHPHVAAPLRGRLRRQPLQRRAG